MKIIASNFLPQNEAAKKNRKGEKYSQEKGGGIFTWVLEFLS